MRQSKVGFTFFVLSIVFLMSIVPYTVFAAESDKPYTDQRIQINSLVKANNDFGFRLLTEFDSQQQAENIFFSPLSIHLALDMTLLGAEGETKEQMAEVLGLGDLEKDELGKLAQNMLTKLSEQSEVDLSIANSIWARQGYPFKEEFLGDGRKYFNARIEEIDFSSPDTLNKINGWVKDKTRGRIEKLIEKLNPLDVMVLLNAMYFQGTWQQKFETEDTSEGTFYLPDGREKQHPLMSQFGSYRYLETNNLQMIRLPYGDMGSIAAYVVLPKKDLGLDCLIDYLYGGEWDDLISRMNEATGEIVLPKFELEFEEELNKPLQEIGMVLPFDKMEANLNGIIEIPGENAYISQAKHKAFLRVTEQGTEAAAATEVTVGVTSALPPEEEFEMVVNRPFLFAIAEEETGTLLFLGGIRDPEEINQER